MALSITALLRQAEASIKKGNVEAAKECYRNVLAQFPKNPQALKGLSALEKRPSPVQTAHITTSTPPKEQMNKLVALYNAGQFQQVIEQTTELAKQYPNSAILFNLMGAAYAELKQLNEAASCFKKTITYNPNNAAAHNNLANVLIDQEKLDEAIIHLRKAIYINPDYAEAHNNLGIAFTKKENIDDAFNCLNNALKLNSDDAEIYFNLGNLALTARCIQTRSPINSTNLLSNQYFLDEALANFNKAISLLPDYVEAWFRKSLVLLAQENFKLGWQAYESRWRKNDFSSKFLKTDKPLWNSGQHNSRLLIWSEQGIGDEVMFGSLLPIMNNLTKKIAVQMDKRLIPLFKRSMPELTFYPKDTPIDESLYDDHLPMGSMGQYCLKEREDFQKITPHYLLSDIERTEKINKQIRKKLLKTIGISWQTSNSQSSNIRSLTLMDFITPFIGINVQLVNLQYGEVSKEIEEVKNTLGIEVHQHHDVDIFSDIDGFSALIEACDLVVSIDNSTVHLAGALGKPTWVLLPVGSDWRWFLDRNDSPWYPSVRLFRKNNLRDWENVLKNIQNNLNELIS